MNLIDGFEHIVRENEPLATYTSLKIGGVAEFFAEPTTTRELAELIQRFSTNNIPIRVIGGGSNILVRDEGVPGLVIHLSAPGFGNIQVDGKRLTAGGGVRLSHFVATCAREGFAGVENLVGIPGTIGGALHGNSGSSGFDIGTWTQHAVCVTRTGEVVDRNKEVLDFSYRSSSLNELAIIQATFEFEKDDPTVLTRQMQRNWIVRRARQPGIDEPTGYIFRDHGGETAGELIERAGLKGTHVGKVELFDPNPNFFIARSGAKSSDVVRLIELVKSQVADRLEIELALAIQLW